MWPGGTVVPGGYAPVVVRDRDHGRRLVPRMWGVPAIPPGEHLVPFLRNLDSPFWVGALRHIQFRCLVPMTHVRQGQDWLSDPERPLVACAGLWRDSEIPSFAILTSGAARGLPVILQPEDCDTWLTAEFKLARHLVGSASG